MAASLPAPSEFPIKVIIKNFLKYKFGAKSKSQQNLCHIIRYMIECEINVSTSFQLMELLTKTVYSDTF
jgi:hypothetical protein